MILVGWRQGHPGTVRWIEQMESYSSVLELIVLAIIAATIWSVVRVVWSGAWGAILLFGVGVLGIVTPMVLYARPRALGTATIPIAALLVLIGGFLLRTVVILSSEAMYVGGLSERDRQRARRLRLWGPPRPWQSSSAAARRHRKRRGCAASRGRTLATTGIRSCSWRRQTASTASIIEIPLCRQRRVKIRRSREPEAVSRHRESDSPSG